MKKAFTLIELLVVIIIIGVLASATFVGLNSVRGKSRDAKRISDVRQLQNALEMYRNDNNSYPADAGVVAGQALVGANGQTYIKKVPTAPGSNDGACTSDSYAYTQDNAGTSYHLTYCLGGVVQSAGPSRCSAVPGDICVPVVSGGGVPSAPFNLSGGASMCAYIYFDWSTPASDGGSPVMGYKVYVGTVSNGETFYETLGVVNNGGIPCTPGTTYYIKITAYNANGESVFSNEHSRLCLVGGVC